MTKRQAFEAILAGDPYDIETRLVYADWLEENGLDDDSAEERRKATEAWCAADQWMHTFALQVGIRHDEAITAGFRGDYGTGMNFNPGDYGFSDEPGKYDFDEGKVEEYWRNWRIVTGREPEHDQGTKAMPFRCCKFEEGW
jgi:uncharacterized protein (TIGR02996 family)